VCDRDGHLRVRLGNDLTERYKILDELGEGTFGKVLECWDRKYKRRIAVKVVRDVERYREGAEAEIEILRVSGREHIVVELYSFLLFALEN
jgi:dual-specificity kinase